MDRNLGLEFVRVTEAAALGAAKWIGRGDKNGADGAAVDEMRTWFNQIDFQGTIVIGEGSKDEAPELYTGEKVGLGTGPVIDLAVDPLECTTSVADGLPNAMSVVASGPSGSLLSAPDTYMRKIAAGPRAKGVIDMDDPVATTVKRVAAALGKEVAELSVGVLDRPRHQKLIAEIRAAGARAKLFSDGDVCAGISACVPDSGIDLLIGTGGSTEAVLAAVAIKILGGELLCRFDPQGDHHAGLVDKAGLDTKKIYRADDLARGDALTFTATGIMSGPLLAGVRFTDTAAVTHSLVVRGESGTMRYVETHHAYSRM